MQFSIFGGYSFFFFFSFFFLNFLCYLVSERRALCAHLLLDIYMNLETLQMLWTCSDGLHVVLIFSSDYFVCIFGVFDLVCFEVIVSLNICID